MAGMDAAEVLKRTCEMLAGTQQAEGEARKAAEKCLDEACEGTPNELVCALVAVLAATGSVAQELRLEATVILRQLVNGNSTRNSVWQSLQDQAKKTLLGQLLQTLEADPAQPVKRSACTVVAAACDVMADDFVNLKQAWPEVFSALAAMVGGTDPNGKVLALGVLGDLVPNFGEGMMQANGSQVIAMLNNTLQDAGADVRAAGAQLVLRLVESNVEEADEGEVSLEQVMPQLILVLQGLAREFKEEPLKDVLEALVSAVDEDADFFKANDLQSLWATLAELSAAGPEAFGDQSVRHTAMEALMGLCLGLSDDVSEPEDQARLERLIGLNIEWMLEVEEDTEAWTREGAEDNEDDCDDDVVGIAEANLDRLMSELDEDVFMTLLFKLIRAAWQDPKSTWKHARAAVMAISQVVEHLEEHAWVNQCVDFIAQNVDHAHPRVRYSAFQAVGQIAFDHSSHIQENHHEKLLPAVTAGINDDNIRVATQAVEAFTSLADEMDLEDLDPHKEDLMQAMLARLQAGQSHAMLESCLSGIAALAKVMEGEFEPYYSDVAPMLRQLIANTSSEKERSLRGKAFECVSMVGSIAGKETFSKDAHEVMQLMGQMMQAGFAPDDPQSESIRAACNNIAETLGKDFKPYVPALLPLLFGVLKQRPVEIDPADMPDDDDSDGEPDMSLTFEGDKVMGLKTTVLEEMKESLKLVNALVESLGVDFCEFLPATCQNLLPLLSLEINEDLRKTVFKSWELLAECARSGVECSTVARSILQELVRNFLDHTVGAFGEVPQGADLDESVLSVMQAKADGAAGVIRKAGQGVLSRDDVQKIAQVTVQLLSKLQPGKDEAADSSVRRRRGVAAPEDEDDDSDNEAEFDTVTKQSARFALADVISSLMETVPADFVEVALSCYMQLVQGLISPSAPESDRGLGFYIVDDVVECLGEKSVPYWTGFMNQALQSVTDKSAMVRQYACSALGNGARHAIFGQMALAAAGHIHGVLKKQGERHRRRRAVKAEAKQTALAVESGIRALGDICEHHEQQLGEHAAMAWEMWLSSLPLKYNQDAGRRAYAQLLRLGSRGHPFLTSPQQQPRVVTILAEVFQSRLSNSALDMDIKTAMSQIGKEKLKELCGGNEKCLKKVDRILR